MAMTRAQLRRAAIIAKCKAAKDKPLERRRVKSFIQPPRNLAINGGEVEGDRSAVGFVDCRRNSHTKYLFSVKSTHGNKASL